MFLRFTTDKGNFKYLKISTKAIQKKASHEPYYKNPDLYIAKIVLPKNVVVESVDSFMDVQYAKVNPIAAFMYGYPDQPNISYQAMLNWLPSDPMRHHIATFTSQSTLCNTGASWIMSTYIFQSTKRREAAILVPQFS